MARRLSVLGLAIVFAIALGHAALGQGPAPKGNTSITGTVVDQQLQPLKGATVSLIQAARKVAGRQTDAAGVFRFAAVAVGDYDVVAELAGFQTTRTHVGARAGTESIQLPIVLMPVRLAETAPPTDAKVTSVVQGIPKAAPVTPPVSLPARASQIAGAGRGGVAANEQMLYLRDDYGAPSPRPSRETYSQFESNRFQRTVEHPLSTFSADVDTASYSNVRRFIQSGQLPPTDAVRVEEFINYFRMSYGAGGNGSPISIATEVGDCPWAPGQKLVLVGAEAHATRGDEIDGRNIVLLIDVSGSMAPANRLPLIKTALAMFVDTLRPDDRLAIVTYAGQSGIALPSTPARQRERILDAIHALGAGGSTNGGQGLVTAYRIARQAFIPGGVNRVILATDGDFNVGIVGQSSLTDLIERERRSGVFLSVLGVGEGNLKDATMEMLADKGNGHYAYLDTLQEARRVLINEGAATLETVAKDVKFQVEFNPAAVAAWKLIGYENRALAPEDFNNDRKDAGEMGAGHSVTVLYQVIPVGVRVDADDGRPDVDPLKYQAAPRPAPRTVAAGPLGELATVKVRYKQPDGDESKLIQHVVRAGGSVVNLPFAAAVAQFGILLRTEQPALGQWDGLVTRLRSVTPPSAVADDFKSFKDLVDLARGIVRSAGLE